MRLHFFKLGTTVLLMLMLLSCSGPSPKLQAGQTDSLIVPSDSSKLYFPYLPKAEGETPAIQKINRHFDSSTVKAWSYFLFRFREPVISNYNGKKEIFRFTWSRTFHAPICIRIERDNDSILLNTKVTDGMGGYGFGKIIQDSTLKLGKEKWDTFISLVENARFWKMSSSNNEILGTDGASWLLEGVQEQNYHWAERWSPGANSPFGKACQYLVSLSSLKIQEKDIY